MPGKNKSKAKRSSAKPAQISATIVKKLFDTIKTISIFNIEQATNFRFQNQENLNKHDIQASLIQQANLYILQGINSNIARDQDGKPQPLSEKKRTQCQEFVNVSDFFLNMCKLDEDFHIRCLSAFWLNSYYLYFDAIVTQEITHRFAPIQAYKDIIDRRFEEVFLYINNYLAKPGTLSISLPTKLKIEPLIWTFLYTFCLVETDYCNAILRDTPHNTELAKMHLKIAEERFETISNFGHLSPQFKPAQMVILAGINPLKRSLYRSPNHPVVTQITNSLERLSLAPCQIEFLSDSLDSVYIDNSYQKLFSNISSPAQHSLLQHSAIFEWVTHPVRFNKLVNSLNVYINKQVPDLSRVISFLNSEKNSDFESIRFQIEKITEIVKIYLYFINLLKSDSNLVNQHPFFTLIGSAWILEIPYLKLISLSSQNKYPNGTSHWQSQQLEFYNQAFMTIYPTLYKIILSLIFNKALSGSESIQERFKKNLDSVIKSLFDFLHVKSLSDLYHNRLEEAQKTCRYSEALLRIVRSNMGHILENISVQEEGYWRLVETKAITTSLKLTQCFYQSLCQFDATLVNPQEQSNASLNTECELTQILQTIRSISPNEVFEYALTALIPILPYCFGSNLGQNFLNEKLLNAILFTITSHIQLSDYYDKLLLNILDLYFFKLLKAKASWAARLQSAELPSIKTFISQIKENNSFDPPIEYFQRQSFIIALELNISSLSEKLTFRDIGLIIKISSDHSQTADLRNLLFLILYEKLNVDHNDLSFEQCKEHYILWNELLSQFITLTNVLSNLSDVNNYMFSDIIKFKIHESLVYFYSGSPSEARIKFLAVRQLIEQFSNQMTIVQMSDVTTQADAFEGQLNNYDSAPYLLTVMEGSTPQHSGSLLQSFQEDYSRLVFSEDNTISQNEAKSIFEKWSQYFVHSVDNANLRALLSSKWKQHYQAFRRQFNQANSFLLTAKPTVPIKPVEFKSIRVQNRQMWQEHIAELEEFRISVIESTNLAREKRKALRRVAPVQHEIFTSPSNSLPESSNTFISELNVPETVQILLKEIAEIKYLAIVSGGYLRDRYLKREPKDIDIFTNCPPEILLSLTTKIEQNRSVSRLCHVVVPKGELPIDVYFMEAKTEQDFVNNLDFTINTLALNAKGEQLQLNDNAISDLNSETIRTVGNCKESFKDPSRIWRMIRLANLLDWSLGAFEKLAIQVHANRLNELSVRQFLPHLRKCFTFDKSLAVKNIHLFHELNIAHYVFSSSPTQKTISNTRFEFCKNALIDLFSKEEVDRIIPAIAILSLLSYESSFDNYLARSNLWLERLEAMSPGDPLIKSINASLHLRLKEYYTRILLTEFRPNADIYIPAPVIHAPVIQQYPPMYIPGYAMHHGQPVLTTSSYITPEPVFYYPRVMPYGSSR